MRLATHPPRHLHPPPGRLAGALTGARGRRGGLRRIWWAAAATAAMVLALPSAAAAQIIGTTVKPEGAKSGRCAGYVLGQLTSDGANAYGIVGRGTLIQWQTNTTLAAPGSPVTFVVLQPTGTPARYTVTGSDAQTLPDPLPASHIATFAIARPIPIKRDDLIGLWAPRDSGAVCQFGQGRVPAADSDGAFAKPSSGSPRPGETVNAAGTSGPGWRVNVAATVIPAQPTGTGALRGSAPEDFILDVQLTGQPQGEGSAITFDDARIDVPSDATSTQYTATGPTKLVLAGALLTIVTTGRGNALPGTDAKLLTSVAIDTRLQSTLSGDALIAPGATITLSLNDHPAVRLRNGPFVIGLPTSTALERSHRLRRQDPGVRQHDVIHG